MEEDAFINSTLEELNQGKCSCQVMGSSPIFSLRSYSLVCSKDNSYFVGIKPILKRAVLNYVVGDINIVYVLKGEVEECKIYSSFTSNVR